MNQELERFEPVQSTGRIVYEHLHRYALSRDYVAGKRVLDIGCGAGYGTDLLAEQAREAVGVDIDRGAVARATKAYRRPNLSYQVADCYDLPFADGEFDAVVANEMIEHIDRQDDFLKEARRVLKTGGLLIVSTPNRPIYNRYKSPNPFHVAEMDIPEFRHLLEGHFASVRLTGLRMALISAAFEMDADDRPANLAAATSYIGEQSSSGHPEIRNEEISLADPEYVLAFCSDEPIEEARHSSIFFSRDDDLWLEHEKVMAWASQLHEEDEVLRADLRRAHSDLDGERRKTDARQHLALSSRLLGRLAGEPVEADPIAVIDALFVLNERMTQQRLRLQTLDSIEQRAQSLERELSEARSESERIQAELNESRLSERRAIEETEKLGRDLDQTRAESSAMEERLSLDLDQARADSSAIRERLGEIEASLAASKRQLDASEKAREELEGAARAEADKAQAASSARERQRARLNSSHAAVRKQLDSASAVGGRLLPREEARAGWLERIRKSLPNEWNFLFDRDWVRRQVGDAGAQTMTLARIVREPAAFAIDPHPLFDAAHYLQRNADVAAEGISPVVHYLRHGWREGRDPHRYFANDWYLERNPDVVAQGVNPLLHYLEHGWREGRWPNPVFDPLAYLKRHADVLREGIEPLTHYVMFGASEDRDVPFAGLERDWRQLIDGEQPNSLMDYLLSELANEPVQARIVQSNGAWPPAPLSDFWIPQALRDFLMESQWEAWVPLYTYLYSVMDLYADDPAGFEVSAARPAIVGRLRDLSTQAAGSSGDDVQASIIIPVFNNILDTLLCILSVLETKPAASFEIIVADDGSTDVTAELIRSIGGVVGHVRQSENLGFVGNCNAAAELAKGQILVLLNNDTLALPGWLDGLVGPFERMESVGLVGSKLINWDGRLQEAGGILWEDGSAWNFGRGQNAADPEFNYLKDVDYVSGASIAVPARIWGEMGGFDPIYKPAYCEDSDLAFRLRKAGLRTLFTPGSQIIHHEGRSHGRDTGEGIKAHQVTNQRHFAERWGPTLARENFPNGVEVLRARDRSRDKPHILVVDHYVPQMDKDAGSRTIFQFLRSLVDAGWSVTFWPENLYRDPIYTPIVQGLGIEVIYGVKYVDKFSDFLRSRSGLYDAVLLSRPHVAAHFIDDVRTLTDARILYYGHDVHFERMKAQRDIANTVDDGAVEAMRTLEVGLCDRCDVILYPAEEEARLMGKLVSKKVQAKSVPAYCFDSAQLDLATDTIERGARSGARPRLLFVGGFSHGPNVDGIVWFCREIAPVLRREGFDFELQIVGSNPTSDVWDLESDDTHVLGFVSDEVLRRCYREASAVIAPLRFGAGVKGKVVEAMANGVPVVTTAVGAQGLADAQQYLFIGDTPEEFAAAVRAGMEPEAAKTKAQRALDYIRSHFSAAAMSDVLIGVLPSRKSTARAA